MPFDRWARADILEKRGPLLAALLAALAALPCLRLPFLADDWALLAAAANGNLGRTPFGYFRPLCALTYAAELNLWGLRPFFFHLTNLALAAAGAALVVMAIRRLTGDASLAGLTGLLFALHPYHVENVSWVAGRADLLFGLLFLLALLAYERWRLTLETVPVAALCLQEAALLSKEAAVSLPVLILILGILDRSRRPGRAEMARGYFPLMALTLSHFVLLRCWALGGLGLGPWAGSERFWAANFSAFVAGAVVPLHTEFLESRPFFWGGVAASGVGLLLLAASRGQAKVPGVLVAASAAFAILLFPSLLSFQERYLFLPGAASALALACLIRRLPPARAAVILAGLGLLWLGSLGWHCMAWSEAGRAGERLIQGLKSASRAPGVEEIVVANMPHRIRAVAVFGNFQEAVALSGGRRVPIRVAAALDYPTERDDALRFSAGAAVATSPSGAEVRLRVPRNRFSRLVLPSAPASGQRIETDWSEVLFGKGGEMTVWIPRAPDGSRSAYVWRGGELVLLFQAAP